MTLRIAPLSRAELAASLDEIAALRIEVFAAYPYLYAGDPAYESRYLATYLDSHDAVVVGAFDRDRLVGAATGTPMEDHVDEFAQAFAGRGIPAEHTFYCAESVLLPANRGQGVGHPFL